MFYKLLMKNDIATFEKAASELLQHGYEPVSGVTINTLIVGQNKITGQHEAAQVFTQGFIGEQELQELSSNDRNGTPLIKV